MSEVSSKRVHEIVEKMNICVNEKEKVHELVAAMVGKKWEKEEDNIIPFEFEKGGRSISFPESPGAFCEMDLNYNAGKSIFLSGSFPESPGAFCEMDLNYNAGKSIFLSGEYDWRILKNGNSSSFRFVCFKKGTAPRHSDI